MEIKKRSPLKGRKIATNEIRLVEKHLIKKCNPFYEEIHNLAWLSKNIYNKITYLQKNRIEELLEKRKEDKTIKIQRFSYMELNTMLKNDVEYPDYRQLPAQTSQQIIKKLDKTWEGYQKSLIDFFKNRNKYSGMPQMPKFKNKEKGRFIVVYSNQGISKKLLAEKNIIKPSGTNIEIKFTKKDVYITEVRFVPKLDSYNVEIVYIEKKEKHDLKPDNKLFIDVGIDNLMTCVDNLGNQPFIICGKIVKSVNRRYNDELERLTSIVELREHGRKSSIAIRKLINHRNNKINTLFHQATAKIIKYCIEKKISKIYIGLNKGWKTKLNTGKSFNRRFTFIPFTKLISDLTYKMEKIGGESIQTEESYTSKCDHLSFEKMEHKEKYLGKRNNKKSIFQSATGIKLHDDVNGAIGIGRKDMKKKEEKQFINMITEKKIFFPKTVKIFE